MRELEKYKKAYCGARHALGMIERNPQVLCNEDYLSSVQKDLDAIITPPVEMETVDVKRSMCGNCGTVWKTDQDCVNCCEATATCEAPIIHLTGSYQRPKPVPVERSVSVEAYVTPDGEVKRAAKDGYVNYPTFKNCEESYHKTGVLTFTWTE